MMEQSGPSFSGEERESLDEYRSVSMFAVASIVLGILSVGSLVHPGVWVVPIIAIGCGFFGLRSIRKQDRMGGTVPAWAGIVLALVCLSWALSQYYFSRWVIYAEAQAVSEQWFRLVLAGEEMIAHQAMLHPAQRQSAGFSVDEYYRMDEKAREDKDKLFSQHPASEVLAMGQDAEITLVSNVTQDVRAGPAKIIRQVYRISAPKMKPVDAMISLTREYRPDLGRATWIVAEVARPE